MHRHFTVMYRSDRSGFSFFSGLRIRNNESDRRLIDCLTNNLVRRANVTSPQLRALFTLGDNLPGPDRPIAGNDSVPHKVHTPLAPGLGIILGISVLRKS